MEKEFKVVQIFKMKNNSVGVSIEVKPEEKIDVLNVQMSEESKKQLWDFVKNDWHNEKIAIVEFCCYYNDGYTPIDPIIKHIKYK